MNVVIIGGAGFIGRHVVRRLLQAGMRVTSIDRQKPLVEQAGERVLVAELLNTEDLERVAKECGPTDAVVWLAASIRHINVVDERAAEDVSIMVEAPLRFLRLLQSMPSSLVYLSSIQVYGRPLYLPVDEDHPVNPFRVYGVAKLCAEHMLAIAAKKHNVVASFHRIAFVYGPGQHADNILPKFVQAVQERKSPVIHGDGGDKRDDIYVEDVARAVELSILKQANGVFNIASGQCHTILDVAKAVCRLSPHNIEPKFDATPSTWIDRCFTVDKAKRSFGFEATTPFETGIRAMWEFSHPKI